ncbi:hypothetical protein AB8Q18_08110 [Neisseriaceae bacterium CLB008]|nr:hypothetical protein [Neisseriaceae bacterium]
MYQYKQSGMANVWLANGYVRVAGEDAEQAQVESIQGLDREIARILFLSDAVLTGRAVRFLRLQLGLNRPELGAMIGVGAESIIQWEQEVTVIPVAADFMIRTLYISKIQPNLTVEALLAMLKKVDRSKRYRLMCHWAGQAWQVHEA